MVVVEILLFKQPAVFFFKLAQQVSDDQLVAVVRVHAAVTFQSIIDRGPLPQGTPQLVLRLIKVPSQFQSDAMDAEP